MESTPESKSLEQISSSPAGEAPEKETKAAPDAWEEPQRVLLVMAHPDDPEFFCGGTTRRWAKAGHTIVYWLLTCGDKGTSNRELTPSQICEMRRREQEEAASVLGVDHVHFLDYEDGYLVPDLKLRRDITRIIRMEKPDILITCDPKTLYIGDNRLNHPDHRAVGEAALAAVYPAARDHLTFIELWRDEELEPHKVREVWIAGTLEPNIILDVTEHWETKINALLHHSSQIGEQGAFVERMRDRLAEGATREAPRYEEAFRRVVLS